MRFHFRHLRDANVSYCSHFCHAWDMISRMMWATGKLICHSVWPDWFETSATDDMKQILEEHEAFAWFQFYEGGEDEDGEFLLEGEDEDW